MLDAFGPVSFSSQAFNGRKVVSVDDKRLISFCQS